MTKLRRMAAIGIAGAAVLGMSALFASNASAEGLAAPVCAPLTQVLDTAKALGGDELSAIKTLCAGDFDLSSLAGLAGAPIIGFLPQ